jgi:transcriptional regulator with XRE-family HTH domain
MTPIGITSDRHLGALFRCLRIQAGLTLDDLGARVHITRKGVSNRELHSRAFSAGAFIETAAALGYRVVLQPNLNPGARPTGTGWPA